VPLVPDVKVTNAALLVAVHAHVLPVVTAAEDVPPSGGNVVRLGCAVNVHVVLVGLLGVDLLQAADVSIANRHPDMMMRSLVRSSMMRHKIHRRSARWEG
jgi:hypothetical protein